MKQLLTTVIILLLSHNSYSQKDSIGSRFKKEIDVNYNWALIGRNLSVNYNQYIGRHALIIGVKQHYNTPPESTQFFVYKNAGHAENFIESIGLNIGYKFDLLKHHDYLMPYLFFQSQISNIRYRRSWTTIVNDQNGQYISRNTETTDPLFTTENIIGFGLKVKLYKNLFLNQTAGLGIATFKDGETHPFANTQLKNFDIDWATSIKLGLICQFHK